MKKSARFFLTVSAASMLMSAMAMAQPQRATLNYEGADLAAVARDVADRTQRMFVIDPRLQGRVSIISPPNLSLSPDEVWEVFLSTLQVNGFAAVPIGDREYKIVPSQQAIKDGGARGGASTVTRVIPLRYVDARTAAANLRGLVGDNAIVTPITESNSLIIVDSGANVQRMLDVLSRIDTDNSVVRTIPLENAVATDIANTLAEILTSQGGERRPGALSVVPVDASNSIILRGNADEVARVIPVIKQLDAKGTGQATLDHIVLDHADAELIVPIIQQFLDTGVPEGQTAGGLRPSVSFHKPTNSLIVNAPPEILRTIRSMVSRLDIRRPQVQIEAVVVEISNTTARELGVQYVTGGDKIPVSAASFTGTSPNIVSAAGAAYFLGPGTQGRTRVVERIDPATGDILRTEEEVFDTNDPSIAVAGQLVEAAIGELLNFNGFLIGAADQTSDGSVFGVLLSAIQSDSASNVLSSPSVTLLDNETGFLGVGQEIPVVTGQATGADFQSGFRTVERKDVGNILEVTPQINAGNTIQLKIRLEISSIGAFTALTDDIITNKSTIETVALAEDGQTLVIGGLIDNDQRNTQSKVPVLGDVPLLGNLFKGQARQEERTTLMVFIRPTILRDGYTADAVTARKYDYVRQQQLMRMKRGETAPLDDVMTNYLGPGDYVVPRADGTLVPLPGVSVGGEAKVE